jgi:hypothetical protein
VRTPLSRLDIDEQTQKRLTEGGVRDVEGVLEITERELARILGDAALAARLRERAKQVLNQPRGGAPRRRKKP